MSHITQFNPEVAHQVETHDFAADPNGAVQRALTDMAYWGIGSLSGVWDPDAFEAFYKKNVSPQEIHTTFDVALAPCTNPFTETLIRKFHDPTEVSLRALMRYRNGSEGLHRDSSFLPFNGVRGVAQVNTAGPSGALVVVTNAHTLNRTMAGSNGRNYILDEPTAQTRFAYANYMLGGVNLLPESPVYPLFIEGSDGARVPLGHPFHFGYQADPGQGHRQIVCIDAKATKDNYIPLPIESSKVFPPADIG